MSRILGRHPDVHSFNELHFFEEIWSPSDRNPLPPGDAQSMIQRLMKNQYESYVSDTKPERYRSQAEYFLHDHGTFNTGFELFEAFLEWETQRNGRSIACSQTPRNVYYAGEILSAYADAYVIWMVRDPRAVLCSQKYRWRRRLWWTSFPSRYDALRAWMNYHPITYSLLWNAAMRTGERFVDHGRVQRVRFEDLVGAPERTMRELLTALGLEFSVDLLQVPQLGSSLRADRPDQRGIDVQAVDRWREGCLDGGEIYLCERLTGGVMARHDYRSTDQGVHPLWIAVHALTWLPKASLAVLMNRARTRSSLLSLRRRLGRLG